LAQFNRGKDSLSKELDITNMIKSAKMINILVQSMMTDEQQLLLGF
jgi:hypothetical protein